MTSTRQVGSLIVWMSSKELKCVPAHEVVVTSGLFYFEWKLWVRRWRDYGFRVQRRPRKAHKLCLPMARVRLRKNTDF